VRCADAVRVICLRLLVAKKLSAPTLKLGATLPAGLGQPRSRAVEESLLRRRLPQGVVPVEVRRLPAAKPLGIEHDAVARIVVAHSGKTLNEPLLQ